MSSVTAAIPNRRNAKVTGGICSFAALTTMKFAAQKAMTARTPASASRRWPAVDGGSAATPDGAGTSFDGPGSADGAADVETPAGLPAGVTPGSGIDGESI
jgi:hypothetical protein